MLEGTSYQTRNGQVEGSAGNSTPYPPQWTHGSYCFKKGTVITIRVVPDPGENIVSWQLTGADLFSLYLLDYYWSIGQGPVLTPDQTYALPALPPGIDITTLDGDIVMTTGSGGGNGPVRRTASFGRSSNIYVVLDTPRTPMSPVWGPVLNYSCLWAIGETTADGANRALTQAEWDHGLYDGIPPVGGVRAFVWNATDATETFYLKSFLAHAPCPYGECEFDLPSADERKASSPTPLARTASARTSLIFWFASRRPLAPLQ